MFRIRSNDRQTATTPVNGVAQKILLEILTSGNTGVLKSVFTSGGNGYEPVNVDRCEDFPRAPIAPRPPAGSPPIIVILTSFEVSPSFPCGTLKRLFCSGYARNGRENSFLPAL